jgi:hypothetical protein
MISQQNSPEIEPRVSFRNELNAMQAGTANLLGPELDAGPTWHAEMDSNEINQTLPLGGLYFRAAGGRVRQSWL